MIQEIAKKLYSLFLINRYAIAVMQNDGNYYTKYFRVTENEIVTMLDKNGAIGCYQQLYKSPYLKWLCFDFDCKDKENPNIENLFQQCVLPLINYLNKKEIYFATEFSGRRGIHIWILLDKFIKKETAYKLIKKIEIESHLDYDKELYGLDEFPATASSKGNKLGKQVKLPLSVHTKGERSFFFEGDFRWIEKTDNFLTNQYDILKKIQLNDTNKLLDNLELDDLDIRVPFKRVKLNTHLQCSVEEIINILSQTNVYRQILERITEGNAISKDWFVMLGTLGKLEKNEEILLDLFKYSPNYSESETRKKIQEYGHKYYPATFDYLYHLYNIDIEENLNPEENGLQYLLRKIGLDYDLDDVSYNEKVLLNDVSVTKEKEKKYLFDNDEVPVVSVYNDIIHMTQFDNYKIEEIINDIYEGKVSEIKINKYYKFIRKEDCGKERIMISLGAHDRILTTHLSLNLFYELKCNFNSFSYNPNYLSSEDIFFYWFSSWGNYIEQIRKYLELDMFNDLSVITIDVRHFYDSIDFLGIYKGLENSLNIKCKRIIETLINYNENLMKKITGQRKGVPQGPAYARIIAEFYLGIILEKLFKSSKYSIHDIIIYRYVDDIIIFYDNNIYNNLFCDLKNTFNDYGLEFNEEKSKGYGDIGSLTQNQKDEILRKGKFQYDLQTSEYSYLLREQDVYEKMSRYLEQKSNFDISDANYIFSKNVDERAKIFYFQKYADKIFSCEFGRGSIFSKFYLYVYNHPALLVKCLVSGKFKLIPIDSINFKNAISNLYICIKNKNISKELILLIKDLFLSNIKIETVKDEEDKGIIEALKNYLGDISYEG
ncbi:TOTE conflict system archaeo-eukaryotic primase domain-containing protein [Clostridium sp. UBA1652]|uniref:TOTE conflict system archaeo-eukaryotic primase domain-containing protein n=1 Tax=Clostridium sp. UBA1652 TaxID=1946348 RepID=UPI00257F2EF4|nr:reverse transcriptase domain-containing protein [Clostridium sp. UBA1652]